MLLGGALAIRKPRDQSTDTHDNHQNKNIALAAQFEVLSQGDNSTCSADFKNSIADMPDGERLRGSCCSPMDMHRYSEQVAGLKEFKAVPYQNITEIPDDPYDIEARLAKRLSEYDDLELAPEEQQAFDFGV